ncbi:MAG: hypothetical protein Q8P50_11625 [Bacillota bacterium]|nr:hypothetical protein [Bacillota bacterium]
MYRLPQLLLEVKRLVAEWQHGGAHLAVEAARRCRCGHPFRHRHGSYIRFVLVGEQPLQIAIPRLYCPACKVTAAVLPSFMARRSAYPSCLKQAAILAYLTGTAGYRWAAARFRVSWELLWAWVDRLTYRAKETLAFVEALLLRYEPSSEPIRPAPRAGRARSAEKDERLAAAVVLFAQALRLWDTGYRQGQTWGRPSRMHLLAFVESCASMLA